jgi:curved DNA-binding protein CbpA
MFANQGKLVLSHFLATCVSIGDEITFPLPTAQAIGAEILIAKQTSSGTMPSLYQAQIGYVTQPKLDKRNQLFVSAEVRQGTLGISSVFLPCEVLRDYFYRLQRDDQAENTTFYDLLRIPTSASPAELRVAFKLRDLELKAAGAPRGEHVALERAFNIVGQPELRGVYDALLADPEAPAVFPYGGFGSHLVAGERSRDGQTFFARRILAFSPERRRRRFHATLRKCEFYDGLALCRDVRRKIELWLDPALLHAVWEPTWNQWKHLLGTKMEVDGTFVSSGKYRKRRGQWEVVTWETALPSRLEIKLAANFEQHLDAAKAAYHRSGQYANAFEQIRLRLEYRAIEKSELERMCSPLRLPGDFDLAQINWRPDYDPFFYHQLARRARRTYLFRGEYIFDLEKAVVVETPQLGHATYVFAKPRSMESFLINYTKITKEDIRRNRDNIAERLGFLCRVIHGTNSRAWLKQVCCRIGEKIVYVAAAAVAE